MILNVQKRLALHEFSVAEQSGLKIIILQLDF
jgi:hypothetical protein